MKKLIKLPFLLVVIAGVCVAVVVNTVVGQQQLDDDPMINRLLNELSSSGVVNELSQVASDVDSPNASDASTGSDENVTILAPVSPVNNSGSATSEQSVSNTLSNTLSSRIIILDQTESVSEPVTANTLSTVVPFPENPAPQAQPQLQAQPQSSSLAVQADVMSEPRLFDIAWADQELYKVNLIPSAWSSLERVQGSSIYHMQLDISEDLRQVEGKQEVLVRNSEGISLDNLYFHLYPNLLGGSIRINRLEVAGQATDVVLERNNSLLNIILPAPLASGAAVPIYMEYTVTLPQNSQRNYGLFGMNESILSLGHAYPQLAVFKEGRWATNTPPPHGDVVYADTAFYVVEITAPQAVAVSSTGTVFPNLTAEATPVSKQRFTVAAGPVRDFYLTASRDYAIAERSAGQTRLRMYYPRSIVSIARPRVEQMLEQTAASLEIFSDRFGLYPYTELDIAAIATPALGIEYPSIVGMSTRFFDNSSRLYGYDLAELLESTIVHEVGHQWFYGIVGSNQVNEPWLDEALTQYITLLYYVDRYGVVGAEDFRQDLRERWNTGRNASKSIDLRTQDYSDREYAAIVYGLGPLVLDKMAQQMGQNNFDALLRTYTQENFWEITSSADFFALAEAYCNCEVARQGSTGERWFNF